MPDQSEAPFHSIESAIEYLDQLLASAREAQKEVEVETLRAADPDQARRKQALQLANFKLEKLATHIMASRRILNDLRMVRRLLLEERNPTGAASASSDAVGGQSNF
jgi:hypothetical protein